MSVKMEREVLQDMGATVVLGTDEKSRRTEEARDAAASGPESLPKLPGLLILKLLGEGGSSKVYLANDESTGDKVALKVLNIDPRDSTTLHRFIQEFTIFATERHPSIARLIERSFTSEFAYLTMEYFPGGDLSERIAEDYSAIDAVAVVTAIAEGLSVAHARGIIHRDIKPRNIMFREDGSLAITDFGIARLDRDSDAAWAARTMTMIGQAIGTPYYMSPEQIDDESQVDHRSDLYSLGVLFFECLTGKKPFQTDSLAEMLDSHLNRSAPELPGEQARFQVVINRLMAKKPEDRFQSAEELIAELAQTEL